MCGQIGNFAAPIYPAGGRSAPAYKGSIMKNPTLKILAVVSFIVLIFGGTAVFLALSLKDMKTEKEALEERVEVLESQLKNCQ